MTDDTGTHEALNPRPGGATPRKRPSPILVALAGALVVSLGLGGSLLWRHAAAPRPPVIAFQSMDPAIVKLIQAEQDMVRQSPYSGPAWGSLGMALYAHHFAQPANACFGEAEQFDPKEPRWPYLRAVCFLQDDPDHSHALPDLIKAAALTADPADAPHLLLAETLLDQGRPVDAEPPLRQALQHDPSSARAMLGLGRIEMMRGNLAAAQDNLAHSYQAFPMIKATQVLLAQVLARRGNAKLAAALAKQAAKASDTNAWPDPFKDEALQMQVGEVADIQRAEPLVITGHFSDAIGLMQETVKTYPDSARAWTLLGAAYTGSGDPVAGEAVLRKSLALDLRSAETINHLGNALARQGRAAEGAKYFRQALAINPRSPEYHFNLGVCLYQEHNFADAVKEFKTSIQLDPDAVKGHASLADALAQEHQNAAAIQQLQIGLRLNPHDPILEKSLARLQGTKLGGQ